MSEIDQILRNFGKKIELLRCSQGMTKVQLAFEMETGEKYIRELEKGNVNVTIKTLFKLANVLNVEPEYLIENLTV